MNSMLQQTLSHREKFKWRGQDLTKQYYASHCIQLPQLTFEPALCGMLLVHYQSNTLFIVALEKSKQEKLDIRLDIITLCYPIPRIDSSCTFRPWVYIARQT